jgi:hypothetical protein
MMELQVRNIPEAYAEVIQALRINGVHEPTRNGPVITLQEPLLVTVLNPRERVLFDPVRDANPFFHVMEFVWMMAGSQDAWWISQFNKRMLEYSDEGILNAAYGFRWRMSRGDQIYSVIKQLKEDRDTRQAVISIWDPYFDGPTVITNDRACNTHIYFRCVDGALDMTVCNRSNDIIWGMTGANMVHMTYLQEMIACNADLYLGKYRIMTNNAHFYENMPKAKEIFGTHGTHDYYLVGEAQPYALTDSYAALAQDCHKLVTGEVEARWNTSWITQVAKPMYDLWFDRTLDPQTIYAEDWCLACTQWLERRKLGKVSRQAGE